ncbi:unnamed protein product [Cuscuta europaea]|uniref:Uncharacterized protein n=1 Tax=Cuscuta europaea TaxID=41803 RepID=A0A9P0ZKN1_CUSEU|nr:unnamed protein product [Cuscuta europaea]
MCVQTGNEDLLSDPSTSDTTPAPKLSCDEIISEDSLFLTLSVSGSKVIPPVDEELLEGFTQVKRRNNKTVRCGSKPDGVCLVVGSCAPGFKDNSTSDVIFSSSSVKEIGESRVHFFGEAFPAGLRMLTLNLDVQNWKSYLRTIWT